jgi:hypothetical protein
MTGLGTVLDTIGQVWGLDWTKGGGGADSGQEGGAMGVLGSPPTGVTT